MGRHIVLNRYASADIRYCTFNNSNSINFNKPMQAGQHMPIDQMKFIAIKSKKNEGYKLTFHSDFKMEFLQVSGYSADSDYIITVFDIGNNKWEAAFSDHDVEIEPPEPEIPPLD